MNSFTETTTSLALDTPELLELFLTEQGSEFNAFPLSFTQQHFWLLDQLNPGLPLYTIPAAVRIAGPLDLPTLARSLEAVVQRHEVLRTTFTMVEDLAVQVLAPRMDVLLPAHDLRMLADPRRAREVRRLIDAEIQRPFDLELGPLVRALALRLGDEEYVLLVTMHHIISDGWSTDVFFRDLMALYDAMLAGAPDPLPPLPIQYADYALWEQEYLCDATLDDLVAYWRRTLDGATFALNLPVDRRPRTTPTNEGAYCAIGLPPAHSDALRALSHQTGVTLYMLLLAAFQVWLQRTTGQDDIVVVSPIAARNRSELEELIGCFRNLLILRTSLGDDPSFRELLGHVREVCLGAFAHQDLPFEQVVRALRLKSRQPHLRLFPVMFSFQSDPRQDTRVAGLTISPLVVERSISNHDLTLYVEDSSTSLSIVFEYDTALFDAATISDLLEDFRCLLQYIVAHSEQPLSSLMSS